MKKKLVVGLMLLSLAGLSAFAACQPDNGNSTGTTNAYSLTLNKETIEIDIFQEFYLVVEYNGTETVKWSVSDSSIVSVENGKLTGLKAGTATVTVTAGEYKDTCTVVVSDYRESLFSLDVDETNISMYKGDTKTPTFSLKYNDTPISVAAQKTFTSSDANVVTVDGNGTLTAKDFGTAMISVVYSFDGKETAATLSVSVVSSGKVKIQQNSATIYALDSLMGQEFDNTVTLSAKAYEKEVEQANATIVWSLEEGQDILSLVGSTLTALNAGTTNVSATYTDKNGFKQTDTITVTVLPVLVDSKKSVVLSKNEIVDGYAADISALVGDAENVLTGAWIATSDEISIHLPYDEGKLDFTTISAGEKKLCLATRNIVYQVDLELWTATIDTAEEMNILYEATDGWYRLGADIDMSTTKWEYPTSKEFLGKFDGNGYAIKKLTLAKYGLFDTLSSSAEIKNVTINATIDSTATEIGALATTVKSGADILIEDVCLYVDIAGGACGGAIGQAIGKISLKGVEGVISNACGDKSNGALFGTVSSMPTFQEVNIYSMFKICGEGEKASSSTEALNKTPNVIVSPQNMLDEMGNLEFDENEWVAIKCDNETYKEYAYYANNIRVYSTTTGTANLFSVDVANRFGGYVDFLFTKENGEVSYFVLPLSSTIYVNNDKFAHYLNTGLALTGSYELTEDIDLSTYTNWKNASILEGTFDGKGHTITGLQTAHNAGLFGGLKGATVKNVVIVDAQLGNKSGVIAPYSTGATIENVYISLGAQSFSEHQSNYSERCAELGIENTDAMGVYTDWPEFKSGVVFQANDTPINIKNSVIYMPEFLSTAGGFVTGYAYYGGVVAENCTFIGGNGRVTGVWSERNYSENKIADTVVITDAVTAHKTYKAAWNEMQKAAYEANHPYVELNSDNIATVIPTLTKEIVVLTEDIDGETSGLNGRSRTKTTFTGVFDGQGKTISNLKSNYWDRGMLLCGYLKGSVKNIIIKCEWTVNYDGGVIADEISGGYLENVYIEQSVNTVTTAPYKIGAIAHKLTEASMKNVVAYTLTDTGAEDAISGFFGKWNGKGNKNIKMENCYYITPCESVSYVGVVEDDNTGMTLEKIALQETFFGIQGFKGATAKADFDAAVEAGTVTISDTLKDMIYPTAGK